MIILKLILSMCVCLFLSVHSCLPQSLLVAQQLANAVGGVMSGAAPGMNQPILIPFNAGGHLGGQQGLVLSLPTANLQSLVAAATAGGIMTLPLQNLQGKKEATVEKCYNKTEGNMMHRCSITQKKCMKKVHEVESREADTFRSWWMF